MRQIVFLVRVFWHSLTSKNRSDWQLVFGCLILASLFWLFNAFSKPYLYATRFEVAFAYSPPHLIAYSALPTHIRVPVRASGWRLLEHILLRSFRPLRFTIGKQKPYILSKATIASAIQASEPHLQILNSDLKPIYLPFSKRAFRRIVLALNHARTSIQPGYGIYGNVVIKPKSVLYSGFDSILAALPDTHWLALAGSPLPSGKFDKMVDLCDHRSTRMSCSPQTARVQLDVVAYVTLKTLKKPLLKNWPKKLRLKAPQISCIYQIAQPDIAIMAAMAGKKFVLVADYSLRSPHGIVPVRVAGRASQIVSITLEPSFLQIPD